MNANSWYLSMIISIFIAVLAFVFGTKVFGYETHQQAREVGIFYWQHGNASSNCFFLYRKRFS